MINKFTSSNSNGSSRNGSQRTRRRLRCERAWKANRRRTTGERQEQPKRHWV